MVRIKNRYLLVNILYPELSTLASKTPDLIAFNAPTTSELTSHLLLKAIRDAILELFGDYGAGAVASSLMIKYLSTATSTFILRVTRSHYRLVWAALSLMNQVPTPSKDGRSCIFRVVRVSGTIRKAEEEAVRRGRAIMLRAQRELGEKSGALLENLLKAPGGLEVQSDRDALMVDASDEGDYDSD